MVKVATGTIEWQASLSKNTVNFSFYSNSAIVQSTALLHYLDRFSCIKVSVILAEADGEPMEERLIYNFWAYSLS